MTGPQERGGDRRRIDPVGLEDRRARGEGQLRVVAHDEPPRQRDGPARATPLGRAAPAVPDRPADDRPADDRPADDGTDDSLEVRRGVLRALRVHRAASDRRGGNHGPPASERALPCRVA